MKYKLNMIGWIGLILTFISMLTSCKKDEKAPVTPITPFVVSDIVGKYACVDMNVYTNDTVYIYYDGVDYKMKSPDGNTHPSTDTIGISIDGVNITIPTQSIYGGFTISGYGTKVLSNQVNFTWTTPSYTVTDAIYIKQ